MFTKVTRWVVLEDFLVLFGDELFYADDTVIMRQNMRNQNRLVHELEEVDLFYGLILNWKTRGFGCKRAGGSHVPKLKQNPAGY